MSEILIVPFLILAAIKLMEWINRQVGIDPRKLVDVSSYESEIIKLNIKLFRALDYGPMIEIPPRVEFRLEPVKLEMRFKTEDYDAKYRGMNFVGGMQAREDSEVNAIVKKFLHSNEIKEFVKHDRRESEHSYDIDHLLRIWIVPIPETL